MSSKVKATDNIFENAFFRRKHTDHGSLSKLWRTECQTVSFHE